MELAHRLLIPEEPEVLEREAHFERVDIVPPGGAIEHQVGVGADPFAQLGGDFDVALNIAPSVELEGLEPDVTAHFDVALILGERRPSHGRGVGGHLGVITTQQLVDRHLGLL